jgi:hypothetical protein
LKTAKHLNALWIFRKSFSVRVFGVSSSPTGAEMEIGRSLSGVRMVMEAGCVVSLKSTPRRAVVLALGPRFAAKIVRCIIGDAPSTKCTIKETY